MFKPGFKHAAALLFLGLWTLGTVALTLHLAPQQPARGNTPAPPAEDSTLAVPSKPRLANLPSEPAPLPEAQVITAEPLNTRPAQTPPPKVQPPKSPKAAWLGTVSAQYDDPANWEGGLPAEGADLVVRAGAQRLQLPAESQLGSVVIEAGARLSAEAGMIRVLGNWENLGTFEPGQATVEFSGSNQTVYGKTAFYRTRFSGGVKRLAEGAALSTTRRHNAKIGEAGVVVEAGTTLLIERGASCTISNAYGFQVAGRLEIDGGTFTCEVCNGGHSGWEDSWLDGSELVLRSGMFRAGGDADFSGASITVYGGSLEVDDDIWHSGTRLEIAGGTVRNCTSGAMFRLSGVVVMSGGTLVAHQTGQRGLRVSQEASFSATGGTLELSGSSLSSGSREDNGSENEGGIWLGTGIQVHDFKVSASTYINLNSAASASLTISGTFAIARNKCFDAQGFRVLATVPNSPDQGEFLP